MRKKLIRKFVTLSMLAVALAAVSSTPAPSTYEEGYCLREPVTAECPSGVVCCTGMGDCSCRQ